MIDLPSNKDRSPGNSDVETLFLHAFRTAPGGRVGRHVAESRVEGKDSNITQSSRSRRNFGIYVQY